MNVGAKIMLTGKRRLPPGRRLPLVMSGCRTDGRQPGMYGPPPCRKRKMRVTGFGLRKCIRPLLEHKLLTLMECAARSSYLVMQPWKAFPVYRFRERRVRPLCHLIVRQQTWQKIINSVVAADL